MPQKSSYVISYLAYKKKNNWTLTSHANLISIGFCNHFPIYGPYLVPLGIVVFVQTPSAPELRNSSSWGTSSSYWFFSCAAAWSTIECTNPFTFLIISESSSRPLTSCFPNPISPSSLLPVNNEKKTNLLMVALPF